MNEHPRGSEWAKWDLHTHTPIDPEWINKPNLSNAIERENFAEEYINVACKQNLKVIAITDHNFCNSIDDLLLPIISEKAKNKGITVLPGFEITAKDGSGIHLLVIFPENSDLNKIKAIVDQLFKPGQAKIPNKGEIPTSTKSIDEIKECIQDSDLDHIFVFAHADRDNGILDKKTINGERRVEEWHKSYVNICQLSKSISDYNPNTFIFNVVNGQDKRYERKITYITASDCRTIKVEEAEENRCYLGQKFVWVKANPTFEGLRQIIFENFDRVRVQKNNPQEDCEKPFFSEINIHTTHIFKDSMVKFCKTRLPLNPNLVTIIGGRGTGKSLLLDTIARTFNKTQKNDRAKNILIDRDDFIVTYQKSDGENVRYHIQDENNLDYLHIHQGEVKEIVDPKHPEKLDDEIKKLLNLSDEDNSLSLEESEIERLINEIFEIKSWLSYSDNEGNLCNSFEFNNRKKKEKNDLIKTITTEEKRQQIDQYIQNLDEINKTNAKIKKLGEILNSFSNFQHRINDEIEKLNEDIDIERYNIPFLDFKYVQGYHNAFYFQINKIPLLDFRDQVNFFKEFIYGMDKHIAELQKKNSEIDTEFKDAGIKIDITGLLEQIKVYQNEINAYENKIEEIEFKDKEINKKFSKISELADSILHAHQERIQEINNRWVQLRNGKEYWSSEQKSLIAELLDGIEIKAHEIFDSSKFYSQIFNCLNLRKFRETQFQTRTEKLEETFQIKDLDSFLKLIRGEKIVNVDGTLQNLAEVLDSDLFSKDGGREFLRILLIERNRKQFWKVQSSSIYKGKEIQQLSIGMRGTFYVCLKLATDPFIKPFVFDQPEDDLDNKFIMRSLVPIFKKIKRYRQVIIVTHNANLVVNADAEQVIVAGNEDENLSYECGAIESPAIRENICNILEGGEPAFMKREKKYGFVNTL